MVVLTSHITAPTRAKPDNPGKYLDAVWHFAGNVLKWGRDIRASPRYSFQIERGYPWANRELVT
jgi:hypothetical protein